jgi:hypothetical protein
MSQKLYQVNDKFGAVKEWFKGLELDLVLLVSIATLTVSINTSFSADKGTSCCEKLDNTYKVELENKTAIEIKLDAIEKRLNSLTVGPKPGPTPTK